MPPNPHLPTNDLATFATKLLIMTKIVSLFALVAMLVSCGNDYVPKPRGYYRVDMPEKGYQSIDCKVPYRFEYPTYATFDLRN